MLMKHLGHLKKQPEQIVETPQNGNMVVNNALKVEDSPATSPATTNWTSPGNVANSASDDVNGMSRQASASSFVMPSGIKTQGMPQQINYSPSSLARQVPTTPTGVTPQSHQTNSAHRRHISDITGGPGDVDSMAKRQQMFAPGQMMNGHVPLGPPLHTSMNAMQQRRSG